MTTRLLNTTAAAAYINLKWGVSCAPSYLNKLRSVGGGPRFHKLGRKVVYRPEHLDEYAQRKLSAPMVSTADTPRSMNEYLDLEMDNGDIEDSSTLWTGHKQFDEITALLHPENSIRRRSQ